MAALCWLPMISLALRTLGFKRTQALLLRCGKPSTRHRTDQPWAAAYACSAAQMVGAAAWRGPYHATCLERSLLLWWLLRRAGIPTDLRIGVRLDAGRLAAHAWVEWDGRPLNVSADVGRRFAAFGQPIIDPARFD
jgi:hypothetical protein